MRKFLPFFVVLMLAAVGARAAGLEYTPEPGEKPALSGERVTVGIGADYVFHQTPSGEPDPLFGNEWGLNATASYTVVDNLAGVVQASYLTDNRAVALEPQARLRLTEPGGPFSIHLALGYIAYGAKDAASVAAFQNEWRVRALGSKTLWKPAPKVALALAGSASYGLQTEALTLQLGIRLAVTASKEGF